MSVKHCCKCNSITTVVDSRPNNKGYISRRRECPNCGIRFTTCEVSYYNMRRMEGKVKKLEKIIALANSKINVR